MSKLASALKDEILRLARKEIKGQIGSTKQASSQHRRDIAQLKRQVHALSKQVAYLERQERKRAAKPVAETTAKGRRFSPNGLKTHRSKVDLSAADYAELVGVSAQTIYNWETGKSKPRPQQLAALVAVRGMGKHEAWKRLEITEE